MTAFKYCRCTCIYLASEPRISVVSAPCFAGMADKDNGLAPSPTRSLSKYGGISARVSPTCNLTDLYNYFQRSAYVRTPVSGLAFRLSLRCTSDTYSLHMQRMPIRKTDTQEQAKLDLGCLFDDLKHGLTKTYHFGS